MSNPGFSSQHSGPGKRNIYFFPHSLSLRDIDNNDAVDSLKIIGGFTYFPLYDITTLGYHAASLNIVAFGIAEAITQAHNNLVPNARLRMNVGELINPQTNIKSVRSPLYTSERVEIKN
jgi:hypothetical protein